MASFRRDWDKGHESNIRPKPNSKHKTRNSTGKPFSGTNTTIGNRSPPSSDQASSATSGLVPGHHQNDTSSPGSTVRLTRGERAPGALSSDDFEIEHLYIEEDDD
ncbi:hypothetical protein HDU93_006429, partial [Gonapodya sp. JEL0774]